MDITRRIKIKILVFDLLFELLMWIGIISCAVIFDKIIETIFFYCCWLIFRYIFPKEYHFKHSKKPLYNILGCLFWSNVLFWVIISNIMPISTSIFISVVASLSINTILYKFQDYIDLKENERKNIINIYSMSEDDLRNYAKSKGLGEMMIDTLVLRVVKNYKWVEIERERNYSKTAIRYHKKIICKSLNVEI